MTIKITFTKERVAELVAEGKRLGIEAGNAAKPVPMHVVAGDLYGRPLPGAVVETVDDGVCGFAWVKIPGNDSFGRTAKALGLTREGYPKGLLLRVGEHDQSLQRKEAHARAYADYLRQHGVNAYAESRID